MNLTMEIIQRMLWLADNNYSKQSQLARNFGVSRDPHELRALLRLQMPKTLEESRTERFKKCAVPSCFFHGTVEHPLDLHHVVPRSQSKSLIDEFTNHLYLCGDFFKRITTRRYMEMQHREEKIGKNSELFPSPCWKVSANRKKQFQWQHWRKHTP